MMRRCFGEKGGFVWRDGYTKYFRYTAIMENIRYTKKSVIRCYKNTRYASYLLNLRLSESKGMEKET